MTWILDTWLVQTGSANWGVRKFSLVGLQDLGPEQLFISVTGGKKAGEKSVLLSFCLVLGQEDQVVNLSHLIFEMLSKPWDQM